MLFAHFARRVIKNGELTIIGADGKRHVCGEGTPAVTLRLHDPKLHWHLAMHPFLHVGEAYMDGTLTVDDGRLYDFLDLCGNNRNTIDSTQLSRALTVLKETLRIIHQYNPLGRARANASHHYDLPDELYELFLDTDRQYSCAYFTHPHDDLDRAQLDKKRHLTSKLRLAPGQRVLDIGSGWGGLAMHLAEAGADSVLGVTLADEQIKVSRERARRAGLDSRVRFELTDYRELDGTFDRIVSVGMFEHVGVRHYADFFAKVRDLLTNDGVALIHSIGRADGPSATNPWLRKYIFPGGYSPALSEVVPVVERSGLWITDIEILRLHYAQTLRLWRERFEANRERIAAMLDDRFCRMWEFYLIGSEMAFKHLNHMVFQMQITKKQDAVPLTRDYMVDYERSLERTSLAAE